MKELNKAIPELAFSILHDESLPKLDFQLFGTFTPDDVYKVCLHLSDNPKNESKK